MDKLLSTGRNIPGEDMQWVRITSDKDTSGELYGKRSTITGQFFKYAMPSRTGEQWFSWYVRGYSVPSLLVDEMAPYTLLDTAGELGGIPDMSDPVVPCAYPDGQERECRECGCHYAYKYQGDSGEWVFHTHKCFDAASFLHQPNGELSSCMTCGCVLDLHEVSGICDTCRAIGPASTEVMEANGWAYYWNDASVFYATNTSTGEYFSLTYDVKQGMWNQMNLWTHEIVQSLTSDEAFTLVNWISTGVVL